MRTSRLLLEGVAHVSCAASPGPNDGLHYTSVHEFTYLPYMEISRFCWACPFLWFTHKTLMDVHVWSLRGLLYIILSSLHVYTCMLVITTLRLIFMCNFRFLHNLDFHFYPNVLRNETTSAILTWRVLLHCLIL